jgi:uncharacterized protein DUF3105
MTSRKEQKEALRREREERARQEQERQARKRMVGIGAAGVLALVAAIVLGVTVIGGGGDSSADSDLLPDGGSVPAQQIDDIDEAVEAAGCEFTSERAKSRDHIQDPDQKVDYPTNPPTSGRHYELPADDGAYDQAPSDEQLVHTLEHGRMIIWFKPSLTRDQRANIYALFNEEEGYQMALVPRRNMDAAVAVSIWSREPEPLGTGRLLTCPEYNDEMFDAIRTIRDEYRGDGPEPVP